MLELLKSISDICLFVPDLERSAKFYQESLGFELKRRDIGFAEFQGLGVTLALWELADVSKWIATEAIGEAGHHFMIAVNVQKPDNVDALYSELSQREVQFIARPKTYPWHARAIYMSDIDGNIWELYAWEDKARTL